MRAVRYNAYGGPEKLELVEIPRPTPGAGQILVKVVCASVNPVDWKRASGKYRLIMRVEFPCVPGYDIAGEVAEVGPGVEGFTVGMKVHSRIGYQKKAGGCAEYALTGVDVTTQIPSGMDFVEAAGLPLAGMTALQGLRDRVGLPLEGARERVLIVGASGGVGHLAVQIARASGATVVGVCSEKNASLVLGLGAHEVIDYKKPNAFQGQTPFDIVLDCVAGDPSPWLPLLVPKGRYASCMPGPATFLGNLLNPFRGKSVRPVMLKSSASDLRILDRLVEAGKLRVVIDSRFPLEDLAKAWERSLSGRAAGKIIVDVAANKA